MIAPFLKSWAGAMIILSLLALPVHSLISIRVVSNRLGFILFLDFISLFSLF